jgi:hypothetical protein
MTQGVLYLFGSLVERLDGVEPGERGGVAEIQRKSDGTGSPGH